MKVIKTNHILLNMKGENLKNGSDDLTIGKIISLVLGGKVSNPSLGWSLGKKFATEDEIDLSAEDIIFIKKELSKPEVNLGATITGQIIEILESK